MVHGEERQQQLIMPQQNQADWVRFLGIARWDEEDAAFFLVGDYTDTGLSFGSIAEEILQQLNSRRRQVGYTRLESACSFRHAGPRHSQIFQPNAQSSAAAQFETTLGYWYVKCLPDGYAYLVSTAKEYPPSVAIECIDELSNVFEAARNKKTNRPCPQECCREILDKYDTMEEGSIAWQLMHEIEEPVRKAYEEQLLAKMQQKIDKLQSQMHDNIMAELENIETAQSLDEKCNDLLLQAALFKKNAAKLPRKSFWNKRRVWVTAAGALAGAGIGIAMGGVGSPAAVPAGIAFAEGIEMTATALVFGAGSNLAYVWAKRRWFSFQKNIRLDLSRIHE